MSKKSWKKKKQREKESRAKVLKRREKLREQRIIENFRKSLGDSNASGGTV